MCLIITLLSDYLLLIETIVLVQKEILKQLRKL